MMPELMYMLTFYSKVFIVRSQEETKSSAKLCGLRDGDRYVFSVQGLHDHRGVANSLSCSEHSLKKIRQHLKSEHFDLIVAIIC